MSFKSKQLTTMSSLQQVAKRLGISLNTARKLVEERRLTTVRISTRCLRIRDEEVENYIAAQQVNGVNAAEVTL